MKNSNAFSNLRNGLLALAIGATTALGAAPAGAQGATEAQAREAQAPSAQTAEAQRINLNVATETELTALPGIGPSRAQAIIAHRERRPFQRVEHLMRVRGIGRATFRRLRSLISVE